MIAAESGVVNTVDPVGGLVRHRSADQYDRTRRPRDPRPNRARRRHAGGHRNRVSSSARSRSPRIGHSSPWTAASRSSSASTGFDRTDPGTDPGTSPGTRVGPALFSVDADVERRQIERVRAVRASRDAESCQRALAAVSTAAREGQNLVVPIVTAVEARATVGEIADTLRNVFGEYAETATV